MLHFKRKIHPKVFYPEEWSSFLKKANQIQPNLIYVNSFSNFVRNWWQNLNWIFRILLKSKNWPQHQPATSGRPVISQDFTGFLYHIFLETLVNIGSGQKHDSPGSVTVNAGYDMLM